MLGGDNVGRLTEKDGSRWQLKNVPWEALGEGQVITRDVSDRVYGALCKLKDYEDTEMDPDKIELLKYHHDERILTDGLKMTLKRKIKELKGSSDYPHNFKGQMVEDFEWVLSLLKSEETPAVYNTGKMYTCNCTGCRHDGSDECMHCMRAYSDCYCYELT